jgi:hypothetical protein
MTKADPVRVKPPAAYEQYSSVTDGHDRPEDKR